jgi:acetyl esterase
VVEHTYTYGSAGGRALPVLAFLPQHHRGRLASVLVVHGGGWNQGSPEGFRSAAVALAQAGMAAFDVGYQLDGPGQPGWPNQTQDLVSAVEWIHGHARSLGVDPGRMGALGSSAGGNLVALLALSLARSPSARTPPLAAVVSWSGPMQLGTRGVPGWLRADLNDYLGCTTSQCPQRWLAASPAANVTHTETAWLLFNSRSELIPVTGAQAMTRALRRAGDEAQLVVYPGTKHAGEYQGRALARTISFLRSHLGPALPQRSAG